MSKLDLIVSASFLPLAFIAFYALTQLVKLQGASAEDAGRAE